MGRQDAAQQAAPEVPQPSGVPGAIPVQEAGLQRRTQEPAAHQAPEPVTGEAAPPPDPAPQ
eukprot:3711348-Alexandrium_andersonii.AAC.1